MNFARYKPARGLRARSTCSSCPTRRGPRRRGLKVFRVTPTDCSSPRRIDKEPGTSSGETHARLRRLRTWRATQQFLLKGTVFDRRDVIGPADVLQKAGRDVVSRFLRHGIARADVGLIVATSPFRKSWTAHRGVHPLKPHGAPRPQRTGVSCRVRGRAGVLHSRVRAPTTTS